MLEFKRLCDAFEELPSDKRALLLKEKSAGVLSRLRETASADTDSVSVLARFMIGSCVMDGRINENEYFIIYPALVRVFGADFDFDTLKYTFRRDREGRRAAAGYSRDMLCLMNNADDELKRDIIELMLCVLSTDGRITLKEKLYIRRLWERLN